MYFLNKKNYTILYTLVNKNVIYAFYWVCFWSNESKFSDYNIRNLGYFFFASCSRISKPSSTCSKVVLICPTHEQRFIQRISLMWLNCIWLTLSLLGTCWAGPGTCKFHRPISAFSRCFEGFILWNSNSALNFDQI